MAKYGKLVDGELRIMPWNTVHTVGGVKAVLGAPAALLSLGYKQIIFTQPPEAQEGFAAVSRWTENDTSLVQVWDMTAIPVDTTPTAEERLEALEAAMLELLGGVLDG